MHLFSTPIHVTCQASTLEKILDVSTLLNFFTPQTYHERWKHLPPFNKGTHVFLLLMSRHGLPQAVSAECLHITSRTVSCEMKNTPRFPVYLRLTVQTQIRYRHQNHREVHSLSPTLRFELYSSLNTRTETHITTSVCNPKFGTGFNTKSYTTRIPRFPLPEMWRPEPQAEDRLPTR